MDFQLHVLQAHPHPHNNVANFPSSLRNPYELTEEDMNGNLMLFHVGEQRGNGVYDGWWNRGSFPPFEDEITILTFGSHEEADVYHRRMNLFSYSSSILRVLFVHRQENYTAIITDRIPTTTLQAWVEINSKWDAGVNGILGFGERYQKIFRGILDVLEICHGEEAFHGSFLNHVRISNDDEVVFTDFPPQFPGVHVENREGIYKDLLDFKSLVNYVVVTEPEPMPIQQVPEVVRCFNGLYTQVLPGNLSLSVLIDRAYLVYHSPLAWSPLARYTFIEKFQDLRRVHFDEFNDLGDDASHYYQIQGEHPVLIPVPRYPINDDFSALVQDDDLFDVVFESCMHYSRFTDSQLGIFLLHRHSYQHGKQFSQQEYDRKLYETFPEALPHIYNGFIHRFRDLIYREYESKTVSQFLKADFNSMSKIIVT